MQPAALALCVILSLGALVAPLSASADTLRCDIAEKFKCQPGGAGCVALRPTIWNEINTTEGTYSRCDEKGCDTFGAGFTSSGAFTVIDVPGRGVVAKISNDGSQFTEAATIMMTTLISYGQCRKK